MASVLEWGWRAAAASDVQCSGSGPRILGRSPATTALHWSESWNVSGPDARKRTRWDATRRTGSPEVSARSRFSGNRKVVSTPSASNGMSVKKCVGASSTSTSASSARAPARRFPTRSARDGCPQRVRATTPRLHRDRSPIPDIRAWRVRLVRVIPRRVQQSHMLIDTGHRPRHQRTARAPPSREHTPCMLNGDATSASPNAAATERRRAIRVVR